MEKKIKTRLILLIIVISITIGLIFSMHIISYEQDWSEETEKHTIQCENIDNPLLKDNCYREVAIMMDDILICEKIELYSQAADKCYLHFAEKNNDHSLCEKMALVENKEYCYLKFAMEKKDTLLCEKMIDKATRELCYYSTGTAYDNALLCEKIEEQLEYRDNCYLNIGVNTKNVCLCTKITDSDTRQVCFALITKDSSFCENITDLIIKDEVCYKKSTGDVEYYDLAMCYEEPSRTTRIDTTLKYSIMLAKEAVSIAENGNAVFWVKYLDNESGLIENATVTLTLYKMVNYPLLPGPQPQKEYSMQYSREEGYSLELWYLWKDCKYCFELYATKEGYESRYEDLGCINLVQ